ncbi:DUF4861 family protein [Salegentibacter sp. BDJ18]|uniref:DUF4861 family protein n=1 Tax=Salegentibacter sp. BDJ18 TaxID=2816376 RepID=UPI001AAEB401|nr:DUF4861 family protein [Salegentibacter sp. BDJ18]MBO2543175.1 DUF4861 family protein [Salegentibacter sp. BDJ18]
MNLYRYIILGTFATISLISCGESKKDQQEGLQYEKEVPKPQTYAEISVKEGGQWVENTYKDGSFINVPKLEVPENHTDHSGYIRYEGPGWENSQVGYRLYLDWRNAIDVFGKKVDTLVLANVGQPYSGSYHDEAGWGLDILKAGKSLGLGGFGRYINDSVVHFREVDNTLVKINNSNSSSAVKIEYTGWTTRDETIDLSAILSIYPEDRFTKVELSPSVKISGLSTGIVKFEDIPLIQKETQDGSWGYIATYGNQTLVKDDDKLGMAIFYKISEVEKTFKGPHDHLVIFNPIESITYYFLAAWEQEINGITSKEEFVKDLNTKLQKLDKEGEL